MVKTLGFHFTAFENNANTDWSNAREPGKRISKDFT